MKNYNAILLFASLLFVSSAVGHVTHSQAFLGTKQDEPRDLAPAVGRIYNIFKGNPLTNGKDPGFTTLDVFTLNYRIQGTTQGKLRIPAEFDFAEELSCSADAVIEEIIGMKSYQSSLSQSCSIEGGYDGLVASASFQASAGFEKKASETQKEEKVSTLRKLECQVYVVQLNENVERIVSPVLAKHFKKFHSTNNWEGFINQYGTHYVNTAQYGAMASEETLMKKTDAEKLEGLGLDFSVKVSGKGSMYSAGVSSETKYTTEQSSALAQTNVETRNIVVGIAPDPDRPNDFNKWVDRVQTSKLVAKAFKYSLLSLETVFDTDYWPDGTNQNDLNAMRGAFIAAMQKVSKQFPAIPADPALNVVDLNAPAKIRILGASYGPADVTTRVQSFLQDQGGLSLFIGTDRGGISDPWWGQLKAFTVFYQYNNGAPRIQSVRDGSNLVIPQVTVSQVGPDFVPSDGLNILGAVFVDKDITETVKQQVRGNALDVAAYTSNFGDPAPYNRKFLSIAYQYGKNAPSVAIAWEGDWVRLRPQ